MRVWFSLFLLVLIVASCCAQQTLQKPSGEEAPAEEGAAESDAAAEAPGDAMERGIAHYRRQEWAEAEAAFRSVAEGSDNAVAWQLLGSTLSQLERYDEARPCFQRALDLGIEEGYIPVLDRYIPSKEQGEEAAETPAEENGNNPQTPPPAS